MTVNNSKILFILRHCSLSTLEFDLLGSKWNFFNFFTSLFKVS